MIEQPPTRLNVGIITAFVALAAGACMDSADRSTSLLEPPSTVSKTADIPTALTGTIEDVSFGDTSIQLWPFTGWNFSGEPSDPVNLLFVGQGDPANIRAALMELSGDRTAFSLPAVPPFNCSWADAAGGIQTNWAEGEWAGSVVQLECGDYRTVRFHLRLFPAGQWTAANAHFEVLIPGTTSHQVLSWNLARQFVQVDLARTGLLEASAPFGAAPDLTPSPVFREIPAVIYNGLPPGLRSLIGGPPVPVTEPVGIANDGTALIANLAGRAPASPGSVHHDFVVAFDQVIPKPFCVASPADFVHARGPVRFTQRVAANTRGEVNAQIQVVGSLSVTPVDIQTGLPSGPTRTAQINDHYSAQTMGRDGRAASTQLRLLTGAGGTGQVESERTRLRVGPRGLTDYSRNERCGT